MEDSATIGEDTDVPFPQLVELKKVKEAKSDPELQSAMAENPEMIALAAESFKASRGTNVDPEIQDPAGTEAVLTTSPVQFLFP